MQEMQETQVGSLEWEDPLEEKMATHSSILAWKIPWTEEPGKLQSIELQRATQLSNWACTQYSIVCMDHKFFIHSSINGHLGCFNVLAIINSAAMNIGVHVSFRIVVFSCYTPSSGIAKSYGSFIPRIFWEISTLFSTVAISICIPPTVQEGSLFATSSPAFIVYRFFYDGHSNWYEVITHCSFDLHFSNNEWCWMFFHVFISHLYVIFGEMSV